MADLLFCSHYPFSAQAKEYVTQKGLQLSTEIIEKAEKRVADAIVLGKIRKVAQLPEAQEEELAIYAASRMIVSACANRYIMNRYCIAEAKRAGEYLASDSSAHPEYIGQVASEFGIKFESTKEGVLVPVVDYLVFSPRSYDYKLSNRRLKAGKVLISSHEKIRILEEAIRKRMESSLPVKAQFPQEVAEAARRIVKLMPKIEISATKVDQKNYPPCIKKLLEDLALNINVPHTGRVALAIYLSSIGMKPEQIIDIFRSAPDFSEKVTRYQVEYISSKKYAMPSCSTMDGYGLCVAECGCGNPLRYKDEIHGARLRRLEKRD
ncbi:MAG: hypothetical protein N3G80_02810 [Candidatus Micrarchaeota archaeon]|nr:hypothetical protein [Candidatus Micrarchaeota archaeon]